MDWKYKKELTPDEVKHLPPDVEVHLEGFDRYGIPTWIEGHVVQSGKKKVFAFNTYYDRETKDIKKYKNKKWMIEAVKE